MTEIKPITRPGGTGENKAEAIMKHLFLAQADGETAVIGVSWDSEDEAIKAAQEWADGDLNRSDIIVSEYEVSDHMTDYDFRSCATLDEYEEIIAKEAIMDKINRTIRDIPAEAYKKIKIEAARREISVNDMLVEAIREYAKTVKE